MATVTVKLTSGEIRSIGLFSPEGENMVTIARENDAIRHVIITHDNDGYHLFRYLRRHNAKQFSNKELLEVIREDLKVNYKIDFTGIIWGQPEVQRLGNENWVCLSNYPIIAEDGAFSTVFSQMLTEKGLNINGLEVIKEELMAYFNDSRP